jgi:cytochrome c oxidase assembly protein subunit 15
MKDMAGEEKIVRPVPRWLHVWAVATVLVTLALLILGQFVTSFRAGMADPVWPTEPWYLADNYKLDLGYLIEHTHRIAGFLVGGFVSILALGIVATEPRRVARSMSIVLVIALLAFFGQFHRELIAQRDPAVEVKLPATSLGAMLAALAGVLIILATGWKQRGAGLRLLAVITLVAVMIQGLLGGFRVRLDALFGPELAPIHGIFAQIVFSLLVSLAALTGRGVTSELPDSTRRILGRASTSLVAVLLVQLVWGALVRHRPDSLNQRLHLITAFVAVGLAVWIIRAGLQLAKPRVRFTAHLLSGLLLLQVVLGVEAWMGKFGEEARAGTAAASYLPEAAAVTKKQAVMRTAHTLVGTGVLAVAVVFALRVRMRPATDLGTLNNLWDTAIAPEPARALSGNRS